MLLPTRTFPRDPAKSPHTSSPRTRGPCKQVTLQYLGPAFGWTAWFEAVRDAFEQNFVQRGELGGACCAYRNGEKVVDLWGGVRNKVTSEPWEEDTMVVVHSTKAN